MDRYGVRVNKASRNTVLFMTDIGTTRSSVASLIEVLVEIVRELDDQLADAGPRDAAAHQEGVRGLTVPGAPLPNVSAFHEAFSGGGDPGTGDIRRAFFTAYDDDLCDYLHPDEVAARMERGEPVVSATFVTPYPPGFPVLVPGQCFSAEILEFMSSLDNRRCTATGRSWATGSSPRRHGTGRAPGWTVDAGRATSGTATAAAPAVRAPVEVATRGNGRSAAARGGG